VVLAVLLYLPSLDVGLVADDYIHWASWHGQTPSGVVRTGSVDGLFALVDGGPARAQAMREQGRLLWTAADDLKLSFWRPLAELTHRLDGHLWPNTPLWMHLHSLLWYGLLVWALVRLYEALEASPRRAHWAALVFAVSALHFFSVTWLAARNQLISALFVVWALHAFHRQAARGTGWRRARWAACGLYVLALLSAEAGVALMAYLLAYQLTLATHDGKGWRRLRPLWPFVLVTLAWRVCHVAWGYGALGSGSYVDPGHEPLRFLVAVATRLPTYAMADLAGWSTGLAHGLAQGALEVYGALAAVALLAWAFALGRVGLWRTPLFRFYALGAVLSLVPACAIEPADRVLIVSEIGACGLIGALMPGLRFPGAMRARAGVLCTVFTAWMVAVHLLIFPLLTLAQSILLRRAMAPGTDDIVTIAREMACPDCQVVLLNAPTPALVSFYHPEVLAHAGAPSIQRLFSMATGSRQDLSMWVLDAHRIRMRVNAGRMDRLERDPDTRPFTLGEVIRCGDIRVRIEALSAAGEPQEVLFLFDRPLNDPRWRFVAWGQSGQPERVTPMPGQHWHWQPPTLAAQVRRAL